MKISTRFWTVVFFAGAFGFAGCSSNSKSGSNGGTAVSSGRGNSAGSVRLKPYEEKVMANGLRLLLIKDESLPSFSFHALVKTGSAQDPSGKSGLASFTESLVSKEPSAKTVIQFSESLGQIGARFEGMSDVDYTYYSASTLSKNQSELLKLVSEALLAPRFSEPEIERHRRQVLAALNARVDDPANFASELFQVYTFGSHPYSRLNIGNERDVKAIGRADLQKFYQKYYRPSNIVMAVVGRLNESILVEMERLFGAWKDNPKDPLEPMVFPKIQDATTRSIRYVKKPGLVQAQIRMGHRGIKRSYPDYTAARVGMTILGGGFSSRLMDRIRDNLGLTYGISSALDGRVDAGLFEIETFTGNRGVGQVISETTSILKDIVEKGVSQEELDRAKGYLSGRFPQAIETGEKLAFNLLLLKVYGIPDTYLTDFQKNLAQLSVGDINRVLRDTIRPEQLQVLVYGQGDEILPQLQLLGPTEVREFTDFRAQ